MANQTDDSGKEPTQTEPERIPGFADVTAYCSRALRSLLLATKASNELPNAGDDFDYYSSFDGFRDVMDIEAKRILSSLQGVMRYHGLKGSIVRNHDASELEDKFDILVDANDQILERVGTFLDEAAGLRKADTALVIATLTPKYISGSWNKKASKGALNNYRLLSAKGITRPQLKFKEKVDNTARLFIPVIKEKPNALKPLPESLMLAQQDNIKMIVDLETDLEFPHPYQHELDHFVAPERLLEKVRPKDPVAVETTPLTLVEDEVALNKVLEKLKAVTEIAVDLEHHSYRTFQGLTCLMQVSTRTEDFIFDTLALRSQLHVLNHVFTNPDVVKVFHGADKDVEWLQRDLGLYVVNMFDTGQAARVLRLPRFSLAYLLSTYAGVQADKHYQLADWRIRPLPDELVKYAREDTHYLLYIYDRLRNELLERSNLNKNLLTSVHHRSTQLCAKRYVKPVYTAERYLQLHAQSKKLFNAQQLHALKYIHAWRDRIARREDESEGYVLPNHMMLQIAELMPKERQGILACCNPIPPILRQSLPEVNAIVMEAREVAFNKPVPKAKTSPLRPPKRSATYRQDDPLYSPHDLTHPRMRNAFFGVPASDLEAGEAGLLSTTWSGRVAPMTAAVKAYLGAFSCHVRPVARQPSEAKLKADVIHKAFVNPYGMYWRKTNDKWSKDGPRTGNKKRTGAPELAPFLHKEVLCRSQLPPPVPDSSIWKLKANTARIQLAKVHHRPEVVREGRALIGKEEEEKGILSLNQIIRQDPPMRKFKKDNRPKQPEVTIEKPEVLIQKPEVPKAEVTTRKRKEKLTAEDVTKLGTHDYSSAGFAVFAATSAKKSKKEKKKDRAKEYNPATVEIESAFKNPSGPRLEPLTGRRSETFGKPKEEPQSAWPKR